jgi:cytochrome-b5 reductase
MRAAFLGCAAGAYFHSCWTSSATATARCEGKFVLNPPAIDPKEFRAFPLVNAYDESPDTKVLRFAFPDGLQEANMKLTSFVLLRYTDTDGKEVIRPYTPISRLDQRGYMEILVKAYKDSKMGTHLHRLKLGQTIEIKGPFEKLPYQPGRYKKIGMIAAGSGITPMFQLARESLKEAKGPEISLIYCNRRKEDVLLGSELSEFYEVHQQFAPYFVLEDPPKDWMGGIGFITKDMIKQIMPPPARALDSIVLVCGPPGFMKHVSGEKDFSKSPPAQGDVGGLLKELGYPASMVYKF